MSLFKHSDCQDFRGLNIGCGNSRIEDYLNVDNGNCAKDMYCDITQELPFCSKLFDAVVAVHVLEHIPRDKFFDVFREIHRVMKVGGLLEFCVPKAGSDNYFTDPTHTMPFTVRTMDFLIEGKQLRENGEIYGADFCFKELEAPVIDEVETIYFKLTKEEN